MRVARRFCSNGVGRVGFTCTMCGNGDAASLTFANAPTVTMRMPCYYPGGSHCFWLVTQTYTRQLSSSRTNGRRGSDRPSKLCSPTLGLRRAPHESSEPVASPRLSPEQLPRLWLEQLWRALLYPTT